MGEFGIGQPVRRREDQRLLTGRGRFVEDLSRAGAAHAWAVRSPHAHAAIRAIDAEAATAAPGVLAVITAADLAADGIGAIPCVTRPPKLREGTEFRERRQPLLADERARFAGDCVAFVVAETADGARDAAELVAVDWEPLPAVTESIEADREGAPPVWEDAPGNLCFEFETGDAAAVEAAFARAARIVTLEVVNNRVVQNALETRGALAWLDEDGKLTLATGTQMPNRMRDQLAEHVFKVPREQVRVLVHDVGGGFGGKNSLYQEQALTLYAARKLGRPVKWTSGRGEAFVSDFHARDNRARGELALDPEGRFLAVRVTGFGNLGAYTATGGPGSPTSVVMLPNAYRTPAVHVRVRGMFTNTVPTDAYRGAGRPEVTYLMERLVDAAARETGIEPAELRRRNLIPPEAFPYTTPTGLTYIHADFAPVMEQAMREAGWAEMPRRREEAQARGRLRGIGISNYIERCGGGGGLSEAGRIRFEPDGGATVLSGSMSNGQGHETAFSQIVHEKLGLPFEKIRIVEGDTDRIPVGLGTGGSWSVPMGGGAIALAADRIVEKARRLAAHLIEAAETDLEFRDGHFAVVGTDLAISLADIAKASRDPARLPPGEEPGLDAEERFKPDNYTYPYGCHIAEVEVDPETGQARLVGYTAVHDFGRALNPMLLAGQVHGGVTQGIGQALLERTVYDADGQLLTGSYMDYCLPRADDVPGFRFTHLASPSPSNPLDIKGCGEAGATGAPPAVINAILDALAPLGVRHLDMPATPERVWAAIRAARRDDTGETQ